MKIFMLSKRVAQVPYEHPVLKAGFVYDYPDEAAGYLIAQGAARRVRETPAKEAPVREAMAHQGAPETAVPDPVKKVRRKRG